MKKAKIALWALRNPRARGLVFKGLKSRRMRGMAWTLARRSLRR